MSRWKVTLDQAACVGSGICVAMSGTHFRAAGDGKSAPAADEIDPDAVVLDAMELCPADAIRVFDVESGKEIAP